MTALKFLERLVEINDGVQETENLTGEVGDVKHGPLVCVEDGKEPEHPTRVNEAPSHEREELDVERVGGEGVQILCNHRERSRHTENGEGLEAE
jgi:hypothetical protein